MVIEFSPCPLSHAMSGVQEVGWFQPCPRRWRENIWRLAGRRASILGASSLEVTGAEILTGEGGSADSGEGLCTETRSLSHMSPAEDASLLQPPQKTGIKSLRKYLEVRRPYAGIQGFAVVGCKLHRNRGKQTSPTRVLNKEGNKMPHTFCPWGRKE
jgi:hypothetical protein